MKKLLVTLEMEVELPDHAELREPVTDAVEMLFIHGRYLLPDLTWKVLDEIEHEPYPEDPSRSIVSCITVSLEDKKLDQMNEYVSDLVEMNMRFVESNEKAGRSTG